MQRDVTLSLIKEINLFVCIYSFIDEIFINQTKETNPIQVMSNCSIYNFKRLSKTRKSRSVFSQRVFVGKWNWKSAFLDKRTHIHTPSYLASTTQAAMYKRNLSKIHLCI